MLARAEGICTLQHPLVPRIESAMPFLQVRLADKDVPEQNF